MFYSVPLRVTLYFQKKNQEYYQAYSKGTMKQKVEKPEDSALNDSYIKRN